MRPQAIAKRMVRTVERLHKRGQEALEVAKEAQSPLRAHNYAAGHGPKGEVADQTGEVATSRANPQRRGGHYGRFVVALRRLEIALGEVDSVMDEIFFVADREDAQKKKLPPGAGHCKACDVWCPGGQDRLKAGLCPADREALTESDETREEFISRRRREVRGNAGQ